jgi:hypothetical protein
MRIATSADFLPRAAIAESLERFEVSRATSDMARRPLMSMRENSRIISKDLFRFTPIAV